MSTRSIIGKVEKDGTIKHIYCHWDGYPSNNGAILVGHWNDSEKIDALLQLGSLSKLGFVIGSKHPFERYSDVYSKDGREAAEKLPEKIEEWCVSHKRDRGDDCDTQTSSDIDKFVKDIEGSFAEWVYLWEDGQWMFSRINNIENRKPLTREEVELAVKEDFTDNSFEGNIKSACELAGWKYSNTVCAD